MTNEKENTVSDSTVQNDTSNGEPLAPIAAITAVVSAVLALLLAFGVSLTVEQTAAILGLVAAVGPIVVWWLGRRKTVPVDNVVALVNKQGDVVASNAANQSNGTPVSVYKSAA